MMPNKPVARICVIGLGYIGLPTAALLACGGNAVVGVDVQTRVLKALAQGRALVNETGLNAVVHEAVISERLIGSQVPVAADAFILAVPTPLQGLAHKRADLSFIREAAESVAPLLQLGNLVILESTSPPGTTEQILRPILERGSGLRAGTDFHLAHCPERVLPGRILHELVCNDRVIGGVDRVSAEAARDLYATFVKGEIHLTDATTAELVKLMENTHRDVNIALANEFALVAEHLQVDIWGAIELANRHPRVQFLRPGPGVGGHCIAVDPWFVVGAAPGFTPLIAAARAVNDSMPLHLVDLVAQGLGSLRGKTVVALGLTYKADVSDTRESPSEEVIRQLGHAGATVRTHDAIVAPEPAIERLADGADCLLLLVDHQAYARLSPERVGRRMHRRLLVDARNYLPPQVWRAAGFDVLRVGDGRAMIVEP